MQTATCLHVWIQIGQCLCWGSVLQDPAEAAKHKGEVASLKSVFLGHKIDRLCCYLVSLLA